MTTEDDMASLRALSEDMAALENSPWQPRCVTTVFARPAPEFVFTMQTWCDLDRARNPLLLGELPPTVPQVEAALEAFGLTGSAELEAPEVVRLAQAMRAAVADGFAMALQMDPPGGRDRTGPSAVGNFASLLAGLVTLLGLNVREALALPAAQAFVLLAAYRENNGWSCAGTPYALRELSNEGTPEPTPEAASEETLEEQTDV